MSNVFGAQADRHMQQLNQPSNLGRAIEANHQRNMLKAVQDLSR